MPGYFAGYEIVAETKNFLVTCEDDADARARAQNIGYTCEADLARLNDLFSTRFEAGKTSPHSIWVVVLKNDPTATANGWNYGYQTEQSSQIWINGTFAPPPPPPPSLIPPDPPPLSGPDLNRAIAEFPRFVFVAELAEILMEFTGYGWDRGQSHGEGLSIALGTLLHPAGYYDAGQGPRINPWLDGGGGPPTIAPRTDFVSNTVDTDGDIFSYGCAILFINYLVDQLGHPLTNVIRAGGSTLAETFARLTGQPVNAAYGVFNELLQAHIGSTTGMNLRSDNIFPLRDVKFRSISTSLGDPIEQGMFTEENPVSWNVKAGLMCDETGYDFFKRHGNVEQPVFAHGRGMAKAAFKWTVAGLELPVRGQWTNATVTSPLTVRNPDGTQTNVSNSVFFQYGILDTWNGSVLYLKTFSLNGNADLQITVSAKEAAIDETEVTAEQSVGLTTVTWVPGEAIKKAWKRCNPFYATVNHSFWYLTETLSDLKNRPDPVPGGALRDVVRAVEQVQDAVAQYAESGQQSVEDVWRLLATPDVLRSADAPPAAAVTRLRARQLIPGSRASSTSRTATGSP